jgi:nitrite reductase/ring-hydroxylating ferredoxin subunit
VSTTTSSTTTTTHRVCPLEEIPVGEGRAYVVGGEQIAVFRHRSGRVSATQARCPHAGGPLADGQIDEAVVVCPLHLNAFDLASGASTSDQPSLAVHPCTVGDDGTVSVQL